MKKSSELYSPYLRADNPIMQYLARVRFFQLETPDPSMQGTKAYSLRLVLYYQNDDQLLFILQHLGAEISLHTIKPYVDPDDNNEMAFIAVQLEGQQRWLKEPKTQTLYNSEAFISINTRYKALNITFYEDFDLSHTNIKGALQLERDIEQHLQAFIPKGAWQLARDIERNLQASR